MSRGIQTKELDEMYGISAIGDAINNLALETLDDYNGDYERARNAASEDMSCALKNMVLKYTRGKYVE